MTLYEIDQGILGCIDPETGEISDFEKFDALQMARDIKIENVAHLITNYEGDIKLCVAQIQAFEDEIGKVENRIESIKRQIKSLEKYLHYALNGEKYKSANMSISFRTMQKVEIDVENVLDLPAEFIRYPEPKAPAPQADKNAIKEAINAGKEVKGAHIVEGLSVTIK